MKDSIKRICIGIVTGALLAYLVYLFTQDIAIVQSVFVQYSSLYFGLLLLVMLILFVFFSVYPLHFKMMKFTLFVFGLGLIIIGQTVLLNDITNKIYLGDIVSLLGVILTLLAWTNILITDKVRKTKADKKVEIIEV